MKVLAFGEILWDVYPDKKHIGGAPLNFAAHLSLHGEDVYLLSAVGNDDLGKEALKQIETWGISTEYITVLNSLQTGSCQVTLDKNSVPSYDLLQDVAYDHIPCDKVNESFDVLYFGTLALRNRYNLTSLKKLLERATFGDIFVDINIRPPFYNKETVNFALQNATILKISLEELPTVAELTGLEFSEDPEIFSKALSARHKNLKCIIITLGSDGAYALDCKTGDGFACPCDRTVKVISTVGAGDSFSAAYLYKYLSGNNILCCLEYASKIAGFVVSKQAAVPDYNAEDFK